jgi:hypothetical protein
MPAAQAETVFFSSQQDETTESAASPWYTLNAERLDD